MHDIRPREHRIGFAHLRRLRRMMSQGEDILVDHWTQGIRWRIEESTITQEVCRYRIAEDRHRRARRDSDLLRTVRWPLRLVERHDRRCVDDRVADRRITLKRKFQNGEVALEPLVGAAT